MFEKKKNVMWHVICATSKKIYTDSIRKLYDRYNETASDKISSSVSYSLKPLYCMPASKKESIDAYVSFALIHMYCWSQLMDTYHQWN